MASRTFILPRASASNSPNGEGSAQESSGITLVAFFTALATSLVVFAVQIGFFLLLRNKLARIFKPKTYLVPERERTESPPVSPWGLVFALMKYDDREIIKKCGLDAYFFLRYLQTLLVIFIPIAVIVIPILIPINYVGGLGHSLLTNATDGSDSSHVTGLDTLAWGNVAPAHQGRRWAHLLLALGVIVWVCYVFFAELRVYIKVRQDHLTSAEHRLRASANTVLVSNIPSKWYTEEALRGLFDVFPGGIRNIWLTRDLTALLKKIHRRDAIHKQLEAAETELIRTAKKKQLKARATEEKKARREHKGAAMSKAERAQRDKQADEEAKRQAENAGGVSVGDHDGDPSQLPAGIDGNDYADADAASDDLEAGGEKDNRQGGVVSKVPILGGGLAKVSSGLKKGVAAVGEAGQGIIGGAKTVQRGVGDELERTGGFDFIPSVRDEYVSAPPTRGSDRARAYSRDDDEKPKVSFGSEGPLQPSGSRNAYSDFNEPSAPRHDPDPRNFGNTTRKATNLDDMYVKERTRWWQFWKPPSGSYASPIPQGSEGNDYFGDQEGKKPFWQTVKSKLPFIGGSDEPPVEYPPAYSCDYDTEKEEGAEWQKWVKESDRPRHRLPLFDWTPGWLPGLPLINKKVDTIYWCRKELARLNMEIEEDQQHPYRYPAMSSAFIQFNNQVAAHMACQSVTHHVPKHMAPRIVEISPNDVIWDNMAMKWWDQWARKSIVLAIVCGMVILWAIPVAWTASLSNIDALIRQYPWLGFLKANHVVYSAVKGIAGVLPAIVLAILLALVPMILDYLADFQGSKTGSEKSEVVQIYYFVFLFVQVFLVVSITGSTLQTITNIGSDITSTPDLLARNLPKAADYFFSYMILQALSTSSGTLLQIGTLAVWFILSRILDSTARNKWERNTKLPSVRWGSFFPVYTNFACIALIYSVIAPLISIFAIITFSLLWVANRYNMLYVTRFRSDTGGVLYPRAVNQTFTGLYVMELCLIGLFFLSTDAAGKRACVPQAIIMIVAMILTALYQYLLNSSFGPLFRYLPITFEDEAVLRDEAFQRAQNRRLGLALEDDEAATLNNADTTSLRGNDIEMNKLDRGRSDTNGTSKLGRMNPVRGIRQAGTWAARGGRQIRQKTFGKAEENLRSATDYRRQRRLKDLEAQRAIGEALYGGYHDEIEDLTPEERDALVRKAFQHYALRARRPTVWIPRDDLGVSDDEVLRTKEFSEYIWISNEGTALDSKVRVVYGRNPPDFSDMDLIDL
ncbi:hypothetical protein VTK73DRAFT_6939 [Phialemonium thermophilum]|uniref:Uncharacterized protein n=1 Tax=Phialemonium thermophilum TaxID=223376 RepID=A0ABR3XTT8_9PEZI